MYYLVYSSFAKDNLSKEELFDILHHSRSKNQDHSISGFLLYLSEGVNPEIIEGKFLQVLEGDEDEVKSLYSKIEKDDRHHHVEVLAEGYKDERLFKKWSMGFRDLDLLKFKHLLNKNNIKESELFEKPEKPDSLIVLDFLEAFYREPMNI